MASYTDSHVADLLEAQNPKATKLYADTVEQLLVGIMSRNRQETSEARMKLGTLMLETSGQAEILGAGIALKEAEAALAVSAKDQAMFERASKQNIIPRVSFDVAIEGFAERAPKAFRAAAQRTGLAIAQAYAKHNIVAFARSAEKAVTAEVQRLIVEGMRKGLSEGEMGRRIAKSAEEIRKRGSAWSQSYARMVWRTNVNSAVTAGRFRQAQDQQVAAVIPAMRFDSVGDSNTRRNHDAGDGVILSVTHPIWKTHAPPLGYNCRCMVVHVSAMELQGMNRFSRNNKVKESAIPRAWQPDEGFRVGAPDQRRPR